MARTWTLEQTLSVASSSFFLNHSRALTNAARTEMYFVRTTSPHKIYKWTGGASLTDMAGSSFPVTINNFELGDICVFNGDLFAAYGPPNGIGSGTAIYRYTSGTSWTSEYTLEGEPANPNPGYIGGGIGGTDSYPWPMDCDNNYMGISGNLSTFSSDTFRRMWTRDTGGNYTINQMPGPSYPTPGYQLVGKSRGSDYGTLFGHNRISSTNFRTIVRGGPSPWTYLAGSDIGAKIPLGYGDGKSFISHNTSGSTWELKYSTDFGVNVSAAGGLTQDGASRAAFKLKNCGSGVIMLSLTSHQAYTWDPATDTFVADGTTSDIDGNRAIYDFFVLNGTLYALTNSVTANSVEIWSAGSVSSSGFYYGRGNLQRRADLPFQVINIGGLAVAYPLAFLGSGAAASPMVAYAGPADSYASFTDFTGGLGSSPIQNFDSTPWGDAAGAAESGEDSGVGGSLSNGKC